MKQIPTTRELKRITLGEFEGMCKASPHLRLILDAENQKEITGIDYILEFNNVSVTQVPDIILLKGSGGVFRIWCIKEVLYDDDESLIGSIAFYITSGNPENERNAKTLCLIMK